METALIGVLGVLLGVLLNRALNWVEKGREQERQRRAVARAILFEMVNFYTHYQEYIRPNIEQIDPQTAPPPVLSAPGPDSFAAYRGNADRLGEFEQETVEAVVRFYGLAERFLATVRDYGSSLDQELMRRASVDTGSAPRRYLKQMQKLMSPMDMAAIAACKKLCQAAAITFESLRFRDN